MCGLGIEVSVVATHRNEDGVYYITSTEIVFNLKKIQNKYAGGFNTCMGFHMWLSKP